MSNSALSSTMRRSHASEVRKSASVDQSENIPEDSYLIREFGSNKISRVRCVHKDFLADL